MCDPSVAHTRSAVAGLIGLSEVGGPARSGELRQPFELRRPLGPANVSAPWRVSVRERRGRPQAGVVGLTVRLSRLLEFFLHGVSDLREQRGNHGAFDKCLHVQQERDAE